MRLERLNYNKIKFFLTLDDLTERGLTKDDIWKDSLKWHQLFHEMLEEASEEFGVEIHGSVAVEIFSMQAQGMIMIVTMEEQEDDENFQDGLIEMQVIMEGEDILFEMDEFETVIQMAKRLANINITQGSLYSFNDQYYFHLANHNPAEINKLVALLTEYGNPSIVSIHMLKEYGNEIIKNKAIEVLIKHFQ
ncbi:adapter protein MecA 1/2 [Cytobacillus eiseniae]|uniref:Adapter protein MecA 1/2 n=1 Tax=Cytobacillus eiseniae TaxID=762947 RepID=A0ABS4RFZ2_9BACI|nr:genetic competence negative regulator [Cytobacillus eiseniae]MBP2240707.1 adapter protein MecA 1/2 [Cytobacillus eiseniae]